MPELKLAKLPDRIPVKITIAVAPELKKALHQYAELYCVQFGQSEPIAELIPYMLTNFLESDKGFAKARKEGTIGISEIASNASERRGRRAIVASPLNFTSEV